MKFIKLNNSNYSFLLCQKFLYMKFINSSLAVSLQKKNQHSDFTSYNLKLTSLRQANLFAAIANPTKKDFVLNLASQFEKITFLVLNLDL